MYPKKSVVPVFKNAVDTSTAKNHRPISILSVVSKVFKNLVNNTLVDHFDKCSLLSGFQYGFRSSRSTAELLTLVSDRIARLLIVLGLSDLYHFMYLRFLTWFVMLIYFINLGLMEFLLRY